MTSADSMQFCDERALYLLSDRLQISKTQQREVGMRERERKRVTQWKVRAVEREKRAAVLERSGEKRRST